MHVLSDYEKLRAKVGNVKWPNVADYVVLQCDNHLSIVRYEERLAIEMSIDKESKLIVTGKHFISDDVLRRLPLNS